MPLVQRLSPPSRASRLRRSSSGSVPELLDAVVATVGHIDFARGVDSHTKRRDKLSIATTRATPLGDETTTGVELLDAAIVAAIALVHSANSFRMQTSIQADQAAHNAVQEHMRLRADHSDIVLIERQFAESPDPPKKLGKMEEDKPERFTLYVTIADHGIAMAEYVYKLRKGDPGWEDTVESWIYNYRTFLRREKLDCGDYDPAFVRFIENRALRINHDKFC